MNEIYELKKKMEEISERCWSAGWIVGLEFKLWDAITKGKPTNYGWGKITKSDISELKRLHKKVGGWWALPHILQVEERDIPILTDMYIETFMSTEDWLAYLDEIKKGKGVNGKTITVTIPNELYKPLREEYNDEEITHIARELLNVVLLDIINSWSSNENDTKPENYRYVYMYDPHARMRVVHVVKGDTAISLVSGHKVKLNTLK